MAKPDHEDMPAVLQDLALEITKDFTIFFLQDEVASDPLFVQGPEGGCVFARLQWSNLDLRKTRRLVFAHHLHPVVMHCVCPLRAVWPRALITSNILFSWIKISCIWIGTLS